MDKAREWTDKELKKMESQISKIYSHASKEVSEKWNEYIKKGTEQISKLEAEYQSVLASGDKDEIKKAKQKLVNAKQAYTLRNDYYKNMVNSVTLDMARVNQMALSYINGQLPMIYIENYEQAQEIIDNLGVSFSLVNKDTIGKMIKDGDIQLPKKRLDIPKDQRWNTKQINSSVLQGILQGEPMYKIADRLMPIMNNNRSAAIRNARTLTTGAENRGRLDSYKYLQDQGVVMKKVWLATPDGRTRDWHVDMDGQETDLNDVFVDGLGNELEYPGDPLGAPETVYNCRCSMITHVIGFQRADGSVKRIDYQEEEESLHDIQMRDEIERRATS